ncbi:MAG: hypothetical protein RML56_12685 [Burkholderiales bacterium]|nr:hypothetical protein [Burkholderiales bacterium]
MEVAQAASGQWLGVCHALGLAMQGDSLDELLASIRDSVQLLLQDLLESGELDAFLETSRLAPRAGCTAGGADRIRRAHRAAGARQP